MTADPPNSGHAQSTPPAARAHGTEAVRYVINGLAATFVNWAVMRLSLDVLHVPLASVAYFVGAVFGITASFLGSRYFVFRKRDKPIVTQGAKFVLSYAIIAVLAAQVMHLWTEWLHYDSNSGFVLATGVQVALSYLVNKFLVFT